MKNSFILFTILLQPIIGLAQNDSTTLSAEQFLQIVRQNHPVVRLANINIEKSDADVQIARGAFNPVINNVITNKTFDNTTYYNFLNPNITIPTWYGLDISAGLENLLGNRFDPSETVGQSSFLGVTIPLVKNLIIDKRRAYVKQSKLYKEMALVEQQIVVNDILLDAITQYWEWANAYQGYVIITKNYEISKTRFEFIKKIVFNGERPAIDTVEAMTQFQNFEVQTNESYLQFQNEGLKLSAFLWELNNIPYQLPDYVVPAQGWENEENIQNFNLQLDDLLLTAQQLHPELRMYQPKFKFLDIEKKLIFQNILPKLDFKYNHLAKGYNMLNTDGLLFQNNFQYSLKLEMPLLFSQGRGEYKKIKLEIKETEIFQAQKMQSIALKVKRYYNEYLNFKNQIILQSNMLSNFQKMLRAEVSLFTNGESSLFLINNRESKVYETERKLVDLKAKYFKAIYSLQWSAGILR